MRDLIKPTLMVVFGLMILFGARVLLVPSKAGFAQEANQMNPNDTREAKDSLVRETYVSEVVLQAPWAMRTLAYDGEESPPGELGLRAVVLPDSLRGKLPDPPLPEGPTSFTVAPNGDIYITDPLNKRIQRFDANGNFVSVIPIPPLDKSKYLDIQELPELSDSAKLESLRRAGKLPKTLHRNSEELKDLLEEPETIDGYQYVWSLSAWTKATMSTCCGGGIIQSRPCANMTREANCWPSIHFSQRSDSGGGRLYCDDSGRLFYEYTRRESDKIIMSLKEELLSKKPYAGYTFQIGTADRVFTLAEQEATLRKKVRRIPNWGKTRELRDLRLPGERLQISNTWNRDFADEEGSYYRFCSTKEGIIIAKWYKQP